MQPVHAHDMRVVAGSIRYCVARTYSCMLLPFNSFYLSLTLAPCIMLTYSSDKQTNHKFPIWLSPTRMRERPAKPD